MTHPNTAAYSAGAVCCPDEPSARHHDRRGERATWLDYPPRIERVRLPNGASTLKWVDVDRRWTR